MGGMGAILYEHEYPGQIDGFVLLSPYLGDDELHAEIRSAGGLERWSPGSPQALSSDTFQRELWRTLKAWQADPQRARAVWLAYGADEPYRIPIELMSPALPADHVFRQPGQHDWTLWTTATPRLLEQARSD
jgi:pimeloyl-ACP methyl ester carboxylesterase